MKFNLRFCMMIAVSTVLGPVAASASPPQSAPTSQPAQFADYAASRDQTTTFTLVDFLSEKTNDDGEVLSTLNVTLNGDRFELCDDSISVIDQDNSGKIEQSEIESAITAAAQLRDTWSVSYVGVKLDYPGQLFYDLTSTLELKSGVVLIGASGGDGQEQFANRVVLRCLGTSQTMDAQIQIGGETNRVSDVGLYGLRIHPSGVADFAGVLLKGANDVFIRHCTFIGESPGPATNPNLPASYAGSENFGQRPLTRNQTEPFLQDLTDAMIRIEKTSASVKVDESTPGNPDPRKFARCWDIYITNNVFRYCMTGIHSRANRLNGLIVQNNLFLDWRMQAIYVLRPYGVDRGATTAEPLGPQNIELFKNTIQPPVGGIARTVKAGNVETARFARQPIAFQKLNKPVAAGEPTYPPTFPSNRIYRVEVAMNSVYGSVDDQSALPNVHNRIASVNTPDPFSGTADMISLHWVQQFRIHSNYIENAGEVGINLAIGCKHGFIEANEVVNNDGPPINIGTHIRNPTVTSGTFYQRYFPIAALLDPTHPMHALVCENVVVRDNTLTNPCRNRSTWLIEDGGALQYPDDMSPPVWARSGILVSTSKRVSIFNNTIDDLTGLPLNLYPALEIELDGPSHFASKKNSVIELNRRANGYTGGNVPANQLNQYAADALDVPSGLMQGVIFYNYESDGLNYNPSLNTFDSSNPFALDVWILD